MVSFFLGSDLGDGLKAIKDRDGIPVSEQMRRGIQMWLESKGYRVKRTQKRKGGTRKR